MKAYRKGTALFLFCLLIIETAMAGTITAAIAEEAKTVAYHTISARTTDTFLDLGNYQVTDLEEFIAFIDQMPALKKVDMYESTLNASQLETLSQRYPNILFGWTLTIGDHTVRTDATAFSTLHNHKSPAHTSADVEVIKYCKNLLALDLGHNAITDISFLEELPNLRILILGRNRIKDTSPIGKLKDLEYLELFSAGVTDISSLKNCTKLMDLNISNNKIMDLSPVLMLPNLERLWLCGSQNGILNRNSFTKKQQQEIVAQVIPSCLVNFTGAGTQAGWRNHPRYIVLSEIFQTGVYRPWQ
jgi:hypothetical protein